MSGTFLSVILPRFSFLFLHNFTFRAGKWPIVNRWMMVFGTFHTDKTDATRTFKWRRSSLGRPTTASHAWPRGRCFAVRYRVSGSLSLQFPKSASGGQVAHLAGDDTDSFGWRRRNVKPSSQRRSKPGARWHAFPHQIHFAAHFGDAVGRLANPGLANMPKGLHSAYQPEHDRREEWKDLLSPQRRGGIRGLADVLENNELYPMAAPATRASPIVGPAYFQHLLRRRLS